MLGGVGRAVEEVDEREVGQVGLGLGGGGAQHERVGLGAGDGVEDGGLADPGGPEEQHAAAAREPLAGVSQEISPAERRGRPGAHHHCSTTTPSLSRTPSRRNACPARANPRRRDVEHCQRSRSQGSTASHPAPATVRYGPSPYRKRGSARHCAGAAATVVSQRGRPSV